MCRRGSGPGGGRSVSVCAAASSFPCFLRRCQGGSVAFLGFQPVLCCGMAARARLALAILWGEAKRRAQVFAGMVRELQTHVSLCDGKG